MELQTSRVYRRQDCAIFLKTNEGFGGLSNMAGGYPLSVNGIRILTSEALYQACRFPHKPDIQKIIIGQKSPMTAKMKSKPYRKDSRPDWDDVRVVIMRWCLRVKLAQNWEKFGELLLSTGNRPIVEESYRDPFWGAKPIDAEKLAGMNVLGQLLTELREQLKGPEADDLRVVEPPDLPQFLLVGKPIDTIRCLVPRKSSAPVPVLSEQPFYEQLALDNQISSNARYEDEKAPIQGSAEPAGLPLQAQMPVEAIPHQLPFEGFESVLPTQKTRLKTHHKKAS